MSGYMCKASWCARIPENGGEEFCRVCLATRAEAKAEGAAEEREAILWMWEAPSFRGGPPWTVEQIIERIRARGSAPAPRCKTCGAALDVMGDCMAARLHT